MSDKIKTGEFYIDENGQLQEKEIELSASQKNFLSAVDLGYNVFLTGKAGTGKSFAVKQAQDMLRKKGVRFASIAPTGIAANNIGGQTIHSLFSLNPYVIMTFEDCRYFKAERRELLDAIECFFIDEVSMLRPDILDAMHWTLRKNGCKGLDKKQVIFVGDLKQLPPVVKQQERSILYERYKGDQFLKAEIYERLNPVQIELLEMQRQSDPEFIEALNNVRDGKKEPYFRQFICEKPEGVILAPYNDTVTLYNNKGLSELDSELLEFEASIDGDIKVESDTNFEKLLQVKDGCRVMYLINNRENGLFNGAIGTFIMKNDMPYIRVDGRELALERVKKSKCEYKFNKETDELELVELGSVTQYPIRLAYALSIHKSQGMTFEEVTLDLTRKCFMDGQLYVGLSRVKSPRGLRIIMKSAA